VDTGFPKKMRKVSNPHGIVVFDRAVVCREPVVVSGASTIAVFGSSLQQPEEGVVRTCTTCVVALAIAAVTTAASSASETSRQRAMPAAQEQTIYRPECPTDEVSSARISCCVAGLDGG
jgi:hypothetical protein